MPERLQRATKLVHLWFDFKGKVGERYLISELKKYEDHFKISHFSQSSVMRFIYTEKLFNHLVKYELTMRSEHFIRILKQFIKNSVHSALISDYVIELFTPYLNKLYPKTYFIFDEEDVDCIKRFVWLAKYIENKNLGLLWLKEDPNALIKALVNCSNDYVIYMNEPRDEIYEKIILNVCSYKNTTIPLLQHEEWVNPIDLKELVDYNLYTNKELSYYVNKLQDVYIPQERSTLLRFLVPTVREHLNEIN